MTSTTERYRAAASQSASTVEKVADFWTQGSKKLTDYVPAVVPQVNLVPIVERYFEFVQRTVDIAMTSPSSGRRQRARCPASSASRPSPLAVCPRAGRAARDVARRGKTPRGGRTGQRPPRLQARAGQDHDKARQRYDGLTKAELSDLLDKRDLPKTGNVDELDRAPRRGRRQYHAVRPTHRDAGTRQHLPDTGVLGCQAGYFARGPGNVLDGLGQHKCPAGRSCQSQVTS